MYIYIYIYIYILYIYNSSFLDPAEEASELWREYKRGEKGEGAASEPKGKWEWYCGANFVITVVCHRLTGSWDPLAQVSVSICPFEIQSHAKYPRVAGSSNLADAQLASKPMLITPANKPS